MHSTNNSVQISSRFHQLQEPVPNVNTGFDSVESIHQCDCVVGGLGLTQPCCQAGGWLTHKGQGIPTKTVSMDMT